MPAIIELNRTKLGEPLFDPPPVASSGYPTTPMSIDLLFADFDRLIQSSESVHRLRRFILDLAVRGKLAPQDPNDEPASELLKRIAAEKARLVKAGAIRKPKILDEQLIDYSSDKTFGAVPRRMVRGRGSQR